MGRRGNQAKRLAALSEETERCTYVARLYGWMALALVTTAVAAGLTVGRDDLVAPLLASRWVGFGVLIFYFLIVAFIDHLVRKASSMVTAMAFFVYSALTGVVAGLLYQMMAPGSLSPTLLLVASVFGVMSVYGYVTKRDLTTLGSLALMALVGFIGASLLNLFRHNGGFEWVVSFTGVLIFVGLTGYGAYEIRKLNLIGNEGTQEDTKEAIVGAMMLYLHLANWIRVFGRRR